MFGKVVKLKNSELVPFFYPNLPVREELYYSDIGTSFIYRGKSQPKLVEYLTKFSPRFISLTGVPTLDLSSRWALLEWIKSKKAVSTPVTLTKDTIEDIPDDSFLERIKILWVTGKWIKESTQDSSLFELFQATTSSLVELMKVCVKVLDATPFPVVESSFLTFLVRVANVESQNVSPGYKRLLREAKQKFGPKIVPALMAYGRSKDKSEFKFINLLFSLR